MFKTRKQNELFYQAGENIQNYAKRTYWGYGLQGLGETLLLASGDYNLITAIGLGTVISSPFFFICDVIGINALKSAGDKLVDLSRLLL